MKHCRTYALCIDAAGNSPEEALQVLELVSQLEQLVNSQTIYNAYIDDEYADAISEGNIKS